jgi:hypothetical protein
MERSRQRLCGLNTIGCVVEAVLQSGEAWGKVVADCGNDCCLHFLHLVECRLHYLHLVAHHVKLPEEFSRQGRGEGEILVDSGSIQFEHFLDTRGGGGSRQLCISVGVNDCRVEVGAHDLVGVCEEDGGRLR